MFVFSSLLYSQIGINTPNPQGAFHVDGAKDNPTTGTPTAAQSLNDILVADTGNVVVGTISPINKLHIIASTAAQGAYNLFDAPGGIGLNGAGILRLRNTLAVATNNIAALGFSNNGPASGGPSWQIGSIRTRADINTGDDFYFSSSNGGTQVEHVRINSLNGNVGVGTSAPTERFSVVDAGNANQFQGTASFFANNLTRGVGIGYGGIQAIGSNANADLNLNAKAAGNIVMQTNGTVGNVGIGSASPTTKLHIEGSEYLNAARTGGTTKNAIDINIGQDGLGYGNRTDNYGINIRSISSIGTGPVARINFGDVNTTTAGLGKYLSFSVGNGLDELIYLTDNNFGRVGIGTTTPTQKLHVIGNILASGTITPSDIRIKRYCR